MPHKHILLPIVAVLALLVVLFAFNDRVAAGPEPVSLSGLAEALEEGRVERLEVSPTALEATLDDESVLSARKERDANLDETLGLLGVDRSALEAVEISVTDGGALGSTPWIPLLLVVALAGALALRMSGTGMPGLSRSKTPGRRRDPKSGTVTFQDVAGVEEAKEELVEVVEFLREPQKFRRVGARIPTGVLLVGPPGTGKTLLARAVAGEAGVPFFSTSGSEFVEMFVGVGASRTRNLFKQAKQTAPAIIFIDEIDAVGRRRGQANSHEEREQTLNQLLVEMDGFDSDENVVVIAATNRMDVLDSALLRPGRFDRRIMVDRPDAPARTAILEVHARGKPVAADVDMARLAKSIPGFVGADIANLVNEAAILAARRNRNDIGPKEFSDAIERIVAGPLRKNRLMSDRERRVVAYHEAGHAVVMHFIEECNAVHKVSIVSRGQMGGFTMALPETESSLYDRSKLLADLAGLLGGRAAEELAIGEITTGASSDMERATGLAREMVTRYGMSEKLGPLVYNDQMAVGQSRVSERVAEDIDREVQRIVGDAYDRAKAVLRQQRDALEQVTVALMEEESLEAEAFTRICDQARESSVVPSPVPTSRGRTREPESAPAREASESVRPRRTGAWVGAGLVASGMFVATGLRWLVGLVRRHERAA